VGGVEGVITYLHHRPVSATRGCLALGVKCSTTKAIIVVTVPEEPNFAN
jgi:hypothetical protein